jgi:hypothetical protein
MTTHSINQHHEWNGCKKALKKVSPIFVGTHFFYYLSDGKTLAGNTHWLDQARRTSPMVFTLIELYLLHRD